MDRKSTCSCFMQKHAIPAGRGLMVIVFEPQQTLWRRRISVCPHLSKATLKPIWPWPVPAGPHSESQQTQRQVSWRMVARKDCRPNGFKASSRRERNDNVSARRSLWINGPGSNSSTKENKVSLHPKHTWLLYLTADREAADREELRLFNLLFFFTVLDKSNINYNCGN